MSINMLNINIQFETPFLKKIYYKTHLTYYKISHYVIHDL